MLIALEKKIFTSDKTKIVSSCSYDEITKSIKKNDILYDISVPIITILSQGDFTDQVAVELALRKYFTDEGYPLSQVGSFKSCHLFGFDSIPQFMYESHDAYEKTLYFNHYINQLIDCEQPELLIIGVPNPIIKFNNRHLQDLGFLPQIVCNAVESDITIICMHYNEYLSSMFTELNNYCKYRMGCETNFFNLTNTILVPEIASGDVNLKYVYVDSTTVFNEINRHEKTDKCHLFSHLSNKSLSIACETIKSVLVKNISKLT